MSGAFACMSGDGLCFQPHICDKLSACAWGADSGRDEPAPAAPGPDPALPAGPSEAASDQLTDLRALALERAAVRAELEAGLTVRFTERVQVQLNVLELLGLISDEQLMAEARFRGMRVGWPNEEPR